MHVTYTPLWLDAVFYNSGCVLFIPDCDMNITVYFLYNFGWALFILVFFFLTTLDVCCLFVIVIWPSLFIFFLQPWMGAVYS